MEENYTRDEVLANAASMNEIVDRLFSNDLPEIEDPEGDLVELPGGLVWGGQVYRQATVRELNGSDEEALSRAMKSNDAFHFLDVVIQRGTETVGGQRATPELLGNMLIGDRDELLIAIRAATYGDEFAIEGWKCPHCNGETDLKFSLMNDLERVRLENPLEESQFEVTLRKGGKAVVRFPNGLDQKAASNKDWTASERNSELLRRCVRTIERDGKTIRIPERPSEINRLSIPDRQAILKEITEKQPGPRYMAVTFKHDECQKDVTLALGVVDMFLELVVVL
jgi:hypothetical protein